MTIDKAVLMFAGFLVLISLALGFYYSPYWFLPGGDRVQETRLQSGRRVQVTDGISGLPHHQREARDAPPGPIQRPETAQCEPRDRPSPSFF